jgi:hypothetical protein
MKNELTNKLKNTINWARPREIIVSMGSCVQDFPSILLIRLAPFPFPLTEANRFPHLGQPPPEFQKIYGCREGRIHESVPTIESGHE